MISAPQPECEGVRDHEVLGTKPISGSTESHRHSAASNGEIAGHMRAVFGGEDLKERSSLQQRLLNSRPPPHEKLIGNRADLYMRSSNTTENFSAINLPHLEEGTGSLLAIVMKVLWWWQSFYGLLIRPTSWVVKLE
jgi:hypothetical protein